ncbi:hypothetical protein BRPE64_ACDS02750 [Caballeronia insecticola]|uniref:Uncharacterized protein n=1 Tax=Caballeronia insecticola TaxID=758793 RepID=R4WF41_9BURK|nr:hypothetical protein BRPE64_ACDS02750 [Caballeronia insecticola]
MCCRISVQSETSEEAIQARQAFGLKQIIESQDSAKEYA